MDKVLFVVDMQEIYLGRGRDANKYSYDADRLISAVNHRIAEYEPEEVFYFSGVAKGLIKGSMPKAGTHEAKLVKELKIVGKNFYEHSKPDVFSVDGLGDLMRSRHVKEVEFAGLDGGTSIGASLVSAIERYNLTVIYNDNGIGTLNSSKASKYRDKVSKTKLVFENY